MFVKLEGLVVLCFGLNEVYLIMQMVQICFCLIVDQESHRLFKHF